MNRRSFFKVVTGFVAGAVGVSAKAKSETKGLICKGKGGTLCPRCKFNYCKPADPLKVKDKLILSRMERLRFEVTEKATQTHPPIFYKEVLFGEPFCGKIVSMIESDGNLWIVTDKNISYVIKNS